MKPRSRSETHLVFGPLDASPAGHDERIVGGNTRDDIDALARELLAPLDVRREVVNMARGLTRSKIIYISERGRRKDGRCVQ
jgi:hypothetical protein